MKFSVLRSFKIDGTWFLPDRGSIRSQGTLRYNPLNGLRLRLESNVLANSPSNGRTPVLLGLAFNGQLITLQDGFRTRSTSGSSGFARIDFLFHRLFVGQHFPEPLQAEISAVDASFNQLFEWLGDSVGRRDWSESGEIDFSFKKPPSVLLLKRDSMAIWTHYLSQVTEHYLYKNAVVRHEAFLRAEFTPPVALPCIFEILGAIQQFLALVRDCTVFPTQVRLAFTGLSVDDPASWCDFIFAPVGGGLLSRSSNHPNISMVNLREEFNEPSNQMLEKWCASAERNRFMYALYFSGRYDERGQLENRFINLVQGLESFHRTNFTNQHFPPDEYASMVAAILDGSPVKHRKWLRDKLEYGNEPTLRKRLKDIFVSYGPYMAGLLRDTNAFITDVVSVRNNFVHGIGSALATPISKLLTLNLHLSCLIEAIAFKELGLSDSMVSRIITARWSSRGLPVR